MYDQINNRTNTNPQRTTSAARTAANRANA
jgi:hypothetical protein